MTPETRERWYERLGRGAPFAVIVAAVLFVAYQLLFILELVAIAALIALVFREIVNGLGRYGLRPWMSVVAIIGVILGFGVFLWLFVVPNVIQEIGGLISGGSGGTLTQAADRAGQGQGVFGIIPNAEVLIERLRGTLSQRISDRASLIVREAFQIGLDTIAALFLALYLAIDPGAPIKGVLKLTPRENRDGMKAFLDELEERLRGWMVGAGVAMLFVGVTAAVGLWLIGIPLPITFGIIAGLLNVVPFLGSILGALLPALIALTISPVKAVLVLALFLLINQIDGNVIQPLVMGSQAQIHPVLILVSFLLLGAFLGPAGLLLAVPAVILIITVLDQVVLDGSLREQRKEDSDDSSEGWIRQLAGRLRGNNE